MKRVAQKLINRTFSLKGKKVYQIKITDRVEPRYAGCSEDCPNFNQLDCYWCREIRFARSILKEKIKFALACLRPGRMMILDTDFLIEVKHEMGACYGSQYRTVNSVNMVNVR